MKRIDRTTVELTDAEWVVDEWHDTLMAEGRNQAQALKEIEDSVPQDGVTSSVIKHPGFREYLLA